MDQHLWVQRWRRAVWVAAWMRLVPFVCMIGLNGSMVTGLMTEESDIDFFVVIKEGHLFTGRLLVTFLVHILGVRRYGRHIAGRVCLNRFASRDFLTIGAANAYHARVFHNLIPLWAEGQTYQDYLEANQWMKDWGYPLTRHAVVLRDLGFCYLLRSWGERVLGSAFLEQKLETWQRQRIVRDPRTSQSGSQVVVSKQELRFHLAKELHESKAASLSFLRE